jgi:hypothetical protein
MLYSFVSVGQFSLLVSSPCSPVPHAIIFKMCLSHDFICKANHFSSVHIGQYLIKEQLL